MLGHGGPGKYHSRDLPALAEQSRLGPLPQETRKDRQSCQLGSVQMAGPRPVAADIAGRVADREAALATAAAA